MSDCDACQNDGDCLDHGTDQGRHYTTHRYPRPRPHRKPIVWTIGDALRFLDPPPPRRTLSRWLLELEPVGERELPQGGPPAKTYRAQQVMERHARWAKNLGEVSSGKAGE